jgi:type I restriction enzyme S subunit
MDTPFWSIDTLFFTDISDKADPRFVFYLFQTIPWTAYNEASGVPSLNSRTIEAIEVRVPSSRHEQEEISRVLADMDAEVETVQAQLSKTRDLKTAMAQELLTGRTRLV